MSGKFWAIFLIGMLLLNMILCGWVGATNGNLTFDRWVSLGSPPEPVVKLTDLRIGEWQRTLITRGRDTSVYIESISGNIYECCEDNVPGAWKRVKEPAPKTKYWRQYCGELGNADVKYFPEEKSHLAVRSCGDWDGGYTIYVLRTDGTVWRLNKFSSELRAFLMIVLIPAASVAAVLVVGLVDLLLRLLRRRKPPEAVCHRRPGNSMNS